MSKSTKLTEKQAEVASIICDLSTVRGSGIAYRDIIREMAIRECVRSGADLTDENIKNNSVEINTITGHIKGIRTKTGKSVITWEDMESGGIKPNSLRSATMAVASRPQESANCRNGSGWSVVVAGNEVAYTIFSEMGIEKHDIMAVVDAIEFCDKFKIPAELSVIDRIAMMAEKQAKMAAAKIAARTAEAVAA